MISKEIEAKVDSYLELNKQNILRDVRRLVNIKSVSVEGKHPEAPFGEGCHKVLNEAFAICHEKGFATTNYDYYAASAVVGSGEKEIAVLGHLDVVPEGSGWSHDPYDMIEKDGYIYGRGVSDDKGPTVLAIYALHCLRELGVKLNYTYRLVMGCSEETGMGDLEHYISNEKMPAFAFTPDADFPVCIGEKGALTIHVRLPLDGKVIENVCGGTVANAVCGSAVAELKGLTEADLGDYCKETYQVEIVKEGIRVTAKGKTSHAAKPEGSINATAVLCKLIATVPQLSKVEMKAASGVLSILEDYNGAGIGVKVEDKPSGKLTHINGIVSVEDGNLVLNINIRYPVTLDGKEIFAKIQEKIDSMGFAVELKNLSPPCYSPANTDEIKALLDAYDHVTGLKGVPYTIGGGTYARRFPNAAAFGPHFPGSVNPAGDGKGEEHMPDECCSIENMMKAVKIYVLALLNLNELSL